MNIDRLTDIVEDDVFAQLPEKLRSAIERYDNEVDRLREKWGEEITREQALTDISSTTCVLLATYDWPTEALVCITVRAVETAYRLGRERG